MIGMRKLILGWAVLFTFAPGFSQAVHAQTEEFTFDFTSSNHSYDATGTIFAEFYEANVYLPNGGSVTIPSAAAAGFTPGTYSYDGEAGTISTATGQPQLTGAVYFSNGSYTTFIDGNPSGGYTLNDFSGIAALAL